MWATAGHQGVDKSKSLAHTHRLRVHTHPPVDNNWSFLPQATPHHTHAIFTGGIKMYTRVSKSAGSCTAKAQLRARRMRTADRLTWLFPALAPGKEGAGESVAGASWGEA